MTFKRATEAQVKAYTVARIRELIGTTERSPDGNTWTQTSLAKALGVSGARISQILSVNPNPGPHIQTALQDLLGMDPLVFHAEARKRFPRAGATPDGETDRYPARAAALQFARVNGLPEIAIREVAGWSMKDGERLTPEDWFEQIKAEAKRQSFGVPAEHPEPDKLEDRAGIHRVPPEHRRKPRSR